MKMKIILSVCLGAILLFSCKDNIIENQKNEERLNELSQVEAQALLENFRKGNIHSKSSSLKINAVQKRYYAIENISTKSGDSEIGKENIPVYEFSISEEGQNGFALVLADKRINNVLAYSPSGSLNDTVFNLGLKYFVLSIPEHIKYSLEEYEKGTSSLKTKSSVEENVSYHYCEIPVKWGQGYPYNAWVPCTCPDLPQKYHGRAPAGCVAVAVAQIMAYHAKSKTRFNWNLLLSNFSVTENSSKDMRDEVADLMYDIGQKVEMSYDCDGSGAYFSKTQFALAMYGYIYDSIKNYDTEGIVRSIDNDCPVLLSGATSSYEGHLWVVDGRRKATVDNKEQTWLMMNWGWDGVSDGWFFCYDNAVFDSGKYEFNRNLSYMGNIIYNGVD